jgi:hypothetical protein
LALAIFAAKEVPLGLVANIAREREFHRTDWPSVEATVSERLRKFDYYFDAVVKETAKLKSLWEM